MEFSKREGLKQRKRTTLAEFQSISLIPDKGLPLIFQKCLKNKIIIFRLLEFPILTHFRRGSPIFKSQVLTDSGNLLRILNKRLDPHPPPTLRALQRRHCLYWEPGTRKTRTRKTR
ncbi:MAG TPA: hypothetical protein PKA63_10175 [Oligoflexia bacterium]|nr:hypothetical protein [Oligoflexia bacterium]HMP49023.1 hypothetical protein [Oligoflexia bacterium]